MKFERVADVKLSSPRNRWLGNMQSDGGRLVFFGTGFGPRAARIGPGSGRPMPARHPEN